MKTLGEIAIILVCMILYYIIASLWRKYFPPQSDDYPQIDGLP